MYDVIVVGARCAGSPTAMLLARAGYRVLLLDRAGFPSDRISTHYVQPAGLARLRRWGLLDDLIATGCPPISRARWWFGDVSVQGFTPPLDGIDVAYGPRRTVLDALLVNAAREAGVEVWEKSTVHDLVMEDGRVIGVRCSRNGGPDQTLTAAVVVGADGRNSLVARRVGAAEYRRRPALTVVYYAYWRGLRRSHEINEVYLHGEAQIGMIPTHDDAILIQAARPSSWYDTYRRDIRGHYHRAIEVAAPDLARELASDGEQVGRFAGTGALENFYRVPYGPGWALVGDAGFHKDPLTGQGITDAWRDAELLATALDSLFSGRQSWDSALSEYQLARDAASELIYEFTYEAAGLQIGPLTDHLLRGLAADRSQADRFFGVLAGAVDPMDFFSPGNIRRLLRGAIGETALAGEPR
nr:NAD(P)/FAD-dependent oxidoreductase [Actinomadura sp. KC216]